MMVKENHIMIARVDAGKRKSNRNIFDKSWGLNPNMEKTSLNVNQGTQPQV